MKLNYLPTNMAQIVNKIVYFLLLIKFNAYTIFIFGFVFINAIIEFESKTTHLNIFL